MNVRLIVIGGDMAGMEIAICVPNCLVGRGDDCHIRLQGELVSQRHCMIAVDGGLLTVEDCGSTNGTLLNGKPIRQRHKLENGDWITIGTSDFEVRFVPGGIE